MRRLKIEIMCVVDHEPRVRAIANAANRSGRAVAVHGEHAFVTISACW